MSDETAERPYTVAQASDKIGCNPKTMYEAIREGKIPTIKIGKRILIPRPAFDRMVAEGS
jgi:excisionase family DNA binding protein